MIRGAPTTNGLVSMVGDGDCCRLDGNNVISRTWIVATISRCTAVHHPLLNDYIRARAVDGNNEYNSDVSSRFAQPPAASIVGQPALRIGSMTE